MINFLISIIATLFSSLRMRFSPSVPGSVHRHCIGITANEKVKNWGGKSLYIIPK